MSKRVIRYGFIQTESQDQRYEADFAKGAEDHGQKFNVVDRFELVPLLSSATVAQVTGLVEAMGGIYLSYRAVGDDAGIKAPSTPEMRYVSPREVVLTYIDGSSNRFTLQHGHSFKNEIQAIIGHVNTIAGKTIVQSVKLNGEYFPNILDSLTNFSPPSAPADKLDDGDGYVYSGLYKYDSDLLYATAIPMKVRTNTKGSPPPVFSTGSPSTWESWVGTPTDSAARPKTKTKGEIEHRRLIVSYLVPDPLATKNIAQTRELPIADITDHQVAQNKRSDIHTAASALGQLGGVFNIGYKGESHRRLERVPTLDLKLDGTST